MKMITSLSKPFLAILVMTTVFIASCKKDQTATPTENASETVSDATDEANAETQFDDVFNSTVGIDDATAGEDLGIGGNIGMGIFSSANTGTGLREDSTHERCFTVTVTPKAHGVFPKTVTIDFGNGCLGRDGKLRKGKIITVYTGKMHIPGSKATTSFDGYMVDSFQVEGTHVVQNVSSSNQRAWNRKVIDGKITNTNSGKWVTWSCDKTHTQVEGNGTPFYPFDDIFNITGSAKGEKSNGNSWTAEISTPLVRKFICYWIVSGTVNISHNGVSGVLDYGNGECDNKATITVNGEVKDITLR